MSWRKTSRPELWTPFGALAPACWCRPTNISPPRSTGVTASTISMNRKMPGHRARAFPSASTSRHSEGDALPHAKARRAQSLNLVGRDSVEPRKEPGRNPHTGFFGEAHDSHSEYAANAKLQSRNHSCLTASPQLSDPPVATNRAAPRANLHYSDSLQSDPTTWRAR